jgi:hypothetical protein
LQIAVVASSPSQNLAHSFAYFAKSNRVLNVRQSDAVLLILVTPLAALTAVVTFKVLSSALKCLAFLTFLLSAFVRIETFTESKGFN